MKRLEDKLMEKTGYTRVAAKEAIGALIDSMEELLIAGEDVKLVKFMTLSKVTKAERVCNVPSTGEKVTVPERMTVKCKVSSTFKATLNK